MPRRTPRAHLDPMEEAIRRAGSIGGLERLARIGQDGDGRYTFWKPFMHLPGGQALDAGCEELKRRIRTQAQVSTPTNKRVRRNADGCHD